MEKRIKLSAFAKSQGITYQAAWKMWERGDIEGIKLESGTILVSGWAKQTDTIRAVIYARVSAPELSEELDKKINIAKKYALNKDYEITNIVKEVVSGMNFERPKLLNILQNKDWDVLIVVEAYDISSLNFELIQNAVALSGKKIEVINPIPQDDKFLLIDLSQKIIAWAKQIIGMGGQKTNIMSILKYLNK